MIALHNENAVPKMIAYVEEHGLPPRAEIARLSIAARVWLSVSQVHDAVEGRTHWAQSNGVADRAADVEKFRGDLALVAGFAEEQFESVIAELFAAGAFD